VRVLVTGAGGFVGRAVSKRLMQAGWTVRALLLPNEDTEVPEGVEVVRGDITKPETLPAAFADCATAIHLAAITGYGVPWEACKRVNIDGTRNVAEAAMAAGVEHLVHMSSVAVYGRVPEVVLDESAAHRSINDPYGDTKIAAEVIVREAEAKGLGLTILRPTVIYGPGDRLFLPKLMDNVRTGRARVIGPGAHPVDLVHVADVADFIVLVLREPAARGQAYNLNHPQNPTWRRMLEIVGEEIGKPAPTGTLPYPGAFLLAGLMELRSRVTGKEPRLTRYAVRVIGRQYRYPTTQAQALGFQPKVSLEDGIRSCIQAMIGAKNSPADEPAAKPAA
jgi:2-alkyl-3-oxoalkanoate reductase